MMNYFRDPEAARLAEAVCDDPHDPAPRHVLADRLEDDGITPAGLHGNADALRGPPGEWLTLDDAEARFGGVLSLEALRRCVRRVGMVGGLPAVLELGLDGYGRVLKGGPLLTPALLRSLPVTSLAAIDSFILPGPHDVYGCEGTPWARRAGHRRALRLGLTPRFRLAYAEAVRRLVGTYPRPREEDVWQSLWRLGVPRWAPGEEGVVVEVSGHIDPAGSISAAVVTAARAACGLSQLAAGRAS